MKTLSSGYILNMDGYKEFLRLYRNIVREFGDCVMTVCTREFRDEILFKSFIEDCLSKRQFNWCAIEIVE
jgi:hypothetical protein